MTNSIKSFEETALLNYNNRKNISKSVTINPKLTGSGQKQTTYTYGLYEEQAIVEEFGIINLATPYQYNILPISLAVSSYITAAATLENNTIQTILQGKITFGSESSMFGVNQENVSIPPAAFSASRLSTPLTPEIIFDIEAGTVLTIPASSGLVFSILHTCINVPPITVKGKQTGNSFRVNCGLSYYLSKCVGVTKTDWPISNIEAWPSINSDCIFAKPQFAKALKILPTVNYFVTGVPTGNIVLQFFTAANYIVSTLSIPWPYGGIFPDIDWPSDAQFVQINNVTNTTITKLTVQHLLSF